MHEYILAHQERKHFYYFVAIIAGLASSGIGLVLDKLQSVVGFLVAAPSGLAIFLLLFLLFDHVIWKWSPLYKFGIVKIPNLAGTWNAKIVTANSTDPILATLTIHQSFTKLRVRLETTKSHSMSQMAVIETIDPTSFKLRYEYSAEFRKDLSTTYRHHGVSELMVSSPNHQFTGEYRARYYTELARDTHGEIVISRKA